MKRSRFPFIVTLFVLAFLYLPIIVLIINSFNESRYGGEWTGFSFKWYQQLWNEDAIWHSLTNSLIIAVSATAASTVLGTMAAFALYRYKTRTQMIHYGMIYAPLVVPDILMGISLLLFFVALNVQLNLFTVFVAHTTFCLSYVVMVILARLQNINYSVIEAAQDLGANTWIIFKKILLPLLSPGLIAAGLLSFTISLDDFIITSFVAGPGSTTLPLYVYSMIKFGSTPLINALSTILLSVTFVAVLFTQRFTMRDQS